MGQGSLPTACRLARHARIALVFCDQIPDLLPPAVTANIGTRIVMRLSGARSTWSVSQSMSLTPEQQAEIPTLEKQKAVVHYMGQPKPFLCRMGEFSFPSAPSEAHIRRRGDMVLGDVPWTPGAEPAANSQEALHGDVVETVFRCVAERPDQTSHEMCKALRVDKATLSEALYDLGVEAGRGLIEIDGKVQNRMFYRLTDKAKQAAGAAGYALWTSHASATHSWLLRHCIEGLKRHFEVEIVERKFSVNGKRPDELLRIDGDRCLALQVCGSPGNYGSEADALEKLAEAAAQPSEIFLVLAKSGEALRGLARCWAICFSICLQRGAPLESLTGRFRYFRFEPSGWTSNKAIPYAHSIADYVCRWLERTFSEQADRATSTFEEIVDSEPFVSAQARIDARDRQLELFPGEGIV
jgi:hypothetical protein